VKKPSAVTVWGLGVLLLSLSAPARADLSPGGSNSFDTFDLSGLTLLASGSGSGSVCCAFSNLDWTLTDAVFADSNNVYGAGDLDFMYQVAFTGTGAVKTVGVSSFEGFSTDAGYTTSGSSLPGGLFVNGVLYPGQDSRSADGAAVTFAWNNSSSENITYNLVIVETNATAYDGNGVANVTANAVDPPLRSSSRLQPLFPNPGCSFHLPGACCC
jgi:hypothetical protein